MGPGPRFQTKPIERLTWIKFDLGLSKTEDPSRSRWNLAIEIVNELKRGGRAAWGQGIKGGTSAPLGTSITKPGWAWNVMSAMRGVDSKPEFRAGMGNGLSGRLVEQGL